MWIKAVLLIILCIIGLLPVMFNERLKVEDNSELRHRILRDPPKVRWTGPETDARINRMLAESIALMEELGVPISKSICPQVRRNGSRYYFGLCCPKGSRKKYSEYDYYIEISGFTLENSEKSLRNTLIHELIHTVPGGLCHTGEWKRWADYVSDNTEYHIQHYDGDKKGRDWERLHTGGYGGLL